MTPATSKFVQNCNKISGLATISWSFASDIDIGDTKFDGDATAATPDDGEGNDCAAIDVGINGCCKDDDNQLISIWPKIIFKKENEAKIYYIKMCLI